MKYSEEGHRNKFISNSIKMTVFNYSERDSSWREKARKTMIKNAKTKEKKHWNWQGGRGQFGVGYIGVYKPDHPFKSVYGYVSEHRLIMEKHISRYLNPEEVVHHLDGNRTNNDLSNLYLFEGNSSHQKYHSFLRKSVKQILEVN